MANKIVRKSKSSAEYWRQREAENLKKYLLSEEEYVKRVHEILDYTADQIQREINGFYSKYADKEGISIAEAKRRIKEADVEGFARKAKRYVKEKNFSKQANDEMRLYNATMKINRLELLKANIGLELVAGFDELQKYDEEILTERTREELERQAGILGNTVQNNEKMVSSIVNASFHHATYSDRIWMYQAMMKTELDKLLRQGLIQGKNPRQLASHLQKLFGVSKYNAERLMRTELARVQIDAQKQSYERNNFEQYTFLALGTACEACLVLDGKHFNVKDMMPGENAPPIHPNCRCSTSAYVDESSYNEWLDTYQEHGMSFEEYSRWVREQNDEIKNRNYKTLSLEEFKKMHHTVSKEERKILYGRTHFSGYINSSHAKFLNKDLRNGKTLSAQYQEISDTLSEVIKRNVIPQDIVVTRFVSIDALEAITGCKYPKTLGLLATKDDIEAYWKSIESIPDRIKKGHKYEEKGFLSVSGVVDKNVMQEKGIRLNIKVPKGSKGYITTNYKESEIIFDKGSKIEILDACIENIRSENTKVILDCIMR